MEQFQCIDNEEIEIIQIRKCMSFFKKTKNMHALSLKIGLCTFLMIQVDKYTCPVKYDGISKY